jgi:AraC-like DNA-binding protein
VDRSERIHREITPLKEGDSILVFDRIKKEFDFHVHFHPEFELNLICYGSGAKRTVGDHFSNITQNELVLVAPNLSHGWEQGVCTCDEIHEITIQFPKDLFHNDLLQRNMMKPIRDMLHRSERGVLFSEECTINAISRINILAKKSGIDAFLELTSLLYDLSISRNQTSLSSISNFKDDFHNSDKMKKLHHYIQTNYSSKIILKNVANYLSMTEISFSRLIKSRTNLTFVEFLNDYRIGYSTRLLVESSFSVAEIAFQCGFNNLSNFNRIFKKRKHCTPSEYRENFAGTKTVN